MKKQLLITLTICLIYLGVNAQNVGIGTNTPKELSKLDVESSTTGFLLPRMTTVQRATLGANVSALGAALSAQYNGMMVYDTDNNTMYMWDSNKSDFTNGGWNNVLDADASIADNDDNPNNEIQDLSLSGNTLSLSGDASTVNLTPYVNTDNQDLSLSGNTLSLTNDASTVNLAPYLDNTDDQKVDVFSLSGNTLNLSLESDGEATKTVDLAPLKDHDWYEQGQTRGADNIGDNIFTNGNVGIGSTLFNERLVVYPNSNNSADIGNAHIGYITHNNWAGFSHINNKGNAGGYALLQNADGRTIINSTTGQVIEFRNNNTTQFEMETDGDLSMAADNSIKMPNNVAYVKNTAVFSPNSAADGYYNITGYTGAINVENGDIIKIDANWNARMEDGSGNDDFYIRVYGDGVTCADRNFNESGWIRPAEGGDDHDNFKSMSYMDYWVANCTGTMRFRLQIRNTGDDDWQVQDAVLFVTKY